MSKQPTVKELLSRLDELHAKATQGPLKWIKVGKSWVLAGDYGMTPFAIVLGRDARLRDAKRDLLVPFDPEHPEAKRVVEALNAWPALSARLKALEDLLGWVDAELENHGYALDGKMRGRIASARARTDATSKELGT